MIGNLGILIWTAFTPVVRRISQRWPIRESQLARHVGVHCGAATAVGCHRSRVDAGLTETDQPKRIGGSARGSRANRQTCRIGGNLEVVVRDDGVGGVMPTREGIGLGNLRRRLEVLYRSGATMTAAGRADGGFEVRLRLPPHPVEIV